MISSLILDKEIYRTSMEWRLAVIESNFWLRAFSTSITYSTGNEYEIPGPHRISSLSKLHSNATPLDQGSSDELCYTLSTDSYNHARARVHGA